MSESEDFIHTKYGYCFYILNPKPFIYNLYIHPQYRKLGHSRTLLEFIITEIRKTGYDGKIQIQAKPREDSIEFMCSNKLLPELGTFSELRRVRGIKTKR